MADNRKAKAAPDDARRRALVTRFVELMDALHDLQLDLTAAGLTGVIEPGEANAAQVALLALSVWHCAESIAILTGSPVALALPMALAIDCGLVACEVALITGPRA